MEGLVEFSGDSRRAGDSQSNVVTRFPEDSSGDARNVGYRPGSAAAMEAWVQTRLEDYGQRDGLPAEEEISRSVVTAAHIVQTDDERFQGSWSKLLIAVAGKLLPSTRSRDLWRARPSDWNELCGVRRRSRVSRGEAASAAPHNVGRRIRNEDAGGTTEVRRLRDFLFARSASC